MTLKNVMKNIFKCFACFFYAKKENVCVKELENIEWEHTQPFLPDVTYGKVIKVYDGDTITIAAKPYHNYPVYRFSVRLNGIDAPELKTKNENEKKHAIISRDALKEKILGRIVNLVNIQHDKYGRILADVFLGNENICKWMLCENYVVEYDGGTKNKPAEWYKYI